MSFRSAPRSGAHGNSRVGRRLADVLEIGIASGANHDDGGVDALVSTLQMMTVNDSVPPPSRNQSERWAGVFSRAGLLNLTAVGPYGFLTKWVVDSITSAAALYDSYQLSQEEYNERLKRAALQLQHGKELIRQLEAEKSASERARQA
tara:strand:+ start:91 stop:534 length:444 start_codon:yes stop_codon:yes gene_type:complete